MNRRQFLKSLVAIPVVVTVPRFLENPDLAEEPIMQAPVACESASENYLDRWAALYQMRRGDETDSELRSRLLKRIRITA